MGLQYCAGDGWQGMKVASQAFKKAAGMFNAAMSAAARIDQAVSTDLSPECLSLLETLCLAHAQRCFYEKAKGDKMKDGILAKLAAGAAGLYAQVASGIAGPQAADRILKLFKGSTWSTDFTVEEAMFWAAAHLHAGKALEVEKKGMEKGKELGHYAAAVAKLTNASKVKVSQAWRAAQVKAALAEAQKCYSDAKKENETVYHCAEEAATGDPEAKSMVKSEPLPDPQHAVGNDLFASLVPDAVRRGAVALATQRQEWCNALVTDMNSDTEDVRRQLSAIAPQIEACDMSEAGLPQRLREKVSKVHEQDGCRGLLQRFNMAQDVKKEVLSTMATARQCVQDEEDADNRLRAQFGTRWTRATSSSLNTILKQVRLVYVTYATIGGVSLSTQPRPIPWCAYRI